MSLVHWNQLQQAIGWRRRNPPAPPANDQPTYREPAPSATTGGIDHLLPQNDVNGNATTRDKKSLDPLFGPNIGAVTSGPAWTASIDKKLVTDDLTPEVVTTWIDKSRDPNQPTTTLQALVNLKRPTIKLSPISDDDSEHSQPHGLEFEYDCDSAKCGIYVHVFLPKSHPDAPPAPPHHPYAKLLVFESVVEGGFAKQLKLDEGAILELGQFEHVPCENEPAAVPAPSSEEPTVNFQEPSARHRRRFTALRFRRGHDPNRSISGPALAVVDAEPQGAHEGAHDGKKEGTKVEDEGVKVIIRLAALDAQGTELSNVNEQVTYLHIVRVGAKPASAEGAECPEDARPWVVKVVKREATIGPHTFHLHEIYGLTSSSTSKPSHSYPPVDMPVISDVDEDPQSECLLCLSSPREVVLLPCRHLVACKECALNMVEFGAGGNITHADAPTSPTAAALAAGDGSNDNANEAVTATPTQGGGMTITVNGTTVTARRKRKAKGWFCPVCRQPYSSLLRITTAPPPLDSSKELGLNSAVDGLPTLASLTLSNNAANNNNTGIPESPRVGFLGNAFSRPNFLRGLTGRGQAAQPPNAVEMTDGVGSPVAAAGGVAGSRPLPLDVENVGGLGRPGS